MGKRKRDDKPARFWVPPAAQSAEKTSSSGEAGGTQSRFWQPEEPLPTDTIWRGTAKRMPPNYTKDRLWNCPSCDVKPNQRHEQWCPRYVYQLNPYISEAYNDKLFLANYFETQIWFGEGHPPMTEERARTWNLDAHDGLSPADFILANAGIMKRKRDAFDDLPEGELPF